MAAVAGGELGPGCPDASAGITAPSPERKIVMLSPARIGFEALTATPAFQAEKIAGS
jgi:hypothetical protein